LTILVNWLVAVSAERMASSQLTYLILWHVG